jgi:hypothetical protein
MTEDVKKSGPGGPGGPDDPGLDKADKADKADEPPVGSPPGEEHTQEAEADTGAKGTPEAAKAGDAPAKEGVQPGGAGTPLPALDFSTFIFSLSSSVLMNLGVVENPVTKKKEKEPAVAKQTIELITLLKEKTTGNLTEQEAKLLDDILHELHLWYVKVVG